MEQYVENILTDARLGACPNALRTGEDETEHICFRTEGTWLSLPRRTDRRETCTPNRAGGEIDITARAEPTDRPPHRRRRAG